MTIAVTTVVAIDTESLITKSSRGFRGVTTPTMVNPNFISFCTLSIPVFFYFKTIVEFAMAGVVSTVSI